MAKKQQAEFDQAYSAAMTVVRYTVEEAARLPGLLGRVAPAMLSARGWYGFTDTASCERVLILTPELAASL